MTVGDALETYKERLKGDHSLKERSKTYRTERIPQVGSGQIHQEHDENDGLAERAETQPQDDEESSDFGIGSAAPLPSGGKTL